MSVARLTGVFVLANLPVWWWLLGFGCAPCEVQPPMQSPSHSVVSCLHLLPDDLMQTQVLKMKAPTAHPPACRPPSSLDPAICRHNFMLDKNMLRLVATKNNESSLPLLHLSKTFLYLEFSHTYLLPLQVLQQSLGFMKLLLEILHLLIGLW